MSCKLFVTMPQIKSFPAKIYPTERGKSDLPGRKETDPNSGKKAKRTQNSFPHHSKTTFRPIDKSPKIKFPVDQRKAKQINEECESDDETIKEYD